MITFRWPLKVHWEIKGTWWEHYGNFFFEGLSGNTKIGKKKKKKKKKKNKNHLEIDFGTILNTKSKFYFFQKKFLELKTLKFFQFIYPPQKKKKTKP
jgi:hypothetical protein